MNLVGPINSGSTTGGAGASASNATSGVRVSGRVLGIYIRYNDAPPATTDVIVKTVGGSGSIPSTTLLTLTNKNTDGMFTPRVIPQDTLGVALAALTIAEPIAIYDYINVAVAQANDGDSVDVWLVVE